MRKSLPILSFFTLSILLSVSLVAQAQAATLSNVKDQISTSRPSPSTVITGQFAGGVSVLDNKSRFLNSDQARLINGTTGAVSQTVAVSQQSADLQTLYFTSNPTTLPSGGFFVTTPITAIHKVQFKTVSPIPASGKIVLSFPSVGATDIASPSATTFSFNGLTSVNASTNIKTNNVTCSSWSIGAPTMTCTVSSTVNAGTTVTILIGCTTNSGENCTVGNPRLINPTKSATAGTADLWKVAIETQDNSSNTIDTGKATIGTIDAVEVRAEVDPTLTFTITGVADSTSLSTLGTGCSDTTNAGTATTSTLVDFGILSSGQIKIAAQLAQVSTNAAGGYVLSGTSSGKLTNPSTNATIKGLNSDTALTTNDVPAPATFGLTNTEGFGISACGPSVSTALWGSGATNFSSGAKYSNPFNSGTNSYYATLATFTGTSGVSLDPTVIRYGATISGTTPAGIYRNNFTYVATATF